jgi:subfamily B ATP-binding cassette protein MsbA
VAVQEGLVRDLRIRLYRHLLTLDLNFFQRTRAGQLISGVMVDADRVKQAVSASLGASVSERRAHPHHHRHHGVHLASASP